MQLTGTGPVTEMPPKPEGVFGQVSVTVTLFAVDWPSFVTVTVNVVGIPTSTRRWGLATLVARLADAPDALAVAGPDAIPNATTAGTSATAGGRTPEKQERSDGMIALQLEWLRRRSPGVLIRRSELQSRGDCSVQRPEMLADPLPLRLSSLSGIAASRGLEREGVSRYRRPPHLSTIPRLEAAERGTDREEVNHARGGRRSPHPVDVRIVRRYGVARCNGVEWRRVAWVRSGERWSHGTGDRRKAEQRGAANSGGGDRSLHDLPPCGCGCLGEMA